MVIALVVTPDGLPLAYEVMAGNTSDTEMRRSDPPVQYLVGMPKGRLRLEKHLIDKPWQEVREGVQVKLLAEDGELYVFAQSDDRLAKEPRCASAR